MVASKVTAGWRWWSCGGDGVGVGGGVEEVGVAEGDVLGAEIDELVDVGEDGVGLDETEAASRRWG